MTTYNVIGLMSGTSLDGVDLAFCTFTYTDHWEYELVKAQTYSYAHKWRDILANAQDLSPKHLDEVHVELGQYYALLIENFINEHQLIPDFIASHGHTAIHRPESGISLQLGCGDAMCNALRMPVVSDFRRQDVQMGGQGAPLVPVGDNLLFSEYDACLNLGGFSNISFDLEGKRLAYDICPVNMALNEVAQITGHAFDKGGAMARSGDIHERLLNQLNSLEFYTKEGPKSLGREWYLKHFQKHFGTKKISPIDLLATLVEHMAIQIARVAKQLPGEQILITGGGAYNDYLIERIAHHSSKDWHVPDQDLVDFKEALVFGLLGVLRMRSDANVYASVTGAPKDHCAGVIHKP